MPNRELDELINSFNPANDELDSAYGKLIAKFAKLAELGEVPRAEFPEYESKLYARLSELNAIPAPRNAEYSGGGAYSGGAAAAPNQKNDNKNHEELSIAWSKQIAPKFYLALDMETFEKAKPILEAVIAECNAVLADKERVYLHDEAIYFKASSIKLTETNQKAIEELKNYLPKRTLTTPCDHLYYLLASILIDAKLYDESLEHASRCISGAYGIQTQQLLKATLLKKDVSDNFIKKARKIILQITSQHSQGSAPIHESVMLDVTQLSVAQIDENLHLLQHMLGISSESDKEEIINQITFFQHLRKRRQQPMDEEKRGNQNLPRLPLRRTDSAASQQQSPLAAAVAAAGVQSLGYTAAGKNSAPKLTPIEICQHARELAKTDKQAALDFLQNSTQSEDENITQLICELDDNSTPTQRVTL